MIPNRIETFCDLSQFVFLREVNGLLARSVGDHSPVIVAEELDGSGRVVRSWFVILTETHDGRGLKAACPTCRIVSRDIQPGKPTPDYDPNNEPIVVQHARPEELKSIRKARDEMLADRERHVIYAQSYIEAVKRAADSEAAAQRLQEQLTAQSLAHSGELQKRDDQLFQLENENQLNRLQIETLQASYLALENRKSLRERVNVWCRSKLNRLKECALRRAV